jgi:hypothetical protein
MKNLFPFYIAENIFDPESMNKLFDRADKTKHGIDKLDIMVHFLPVIESSGRKAKNNFTRFKSFLCEKLKRGITAVEEKNLLEGIVKYLQSEQATNARTEAMDYLFDLKFLND